MSACAISCVHGPDGPPPLHGYVTDDTQMTLALDDALRATVGGTPARVRAAVLREFLAWAPKVRQALAWVAAKHVAAQVEAMRSAYRVARVELADQVGPEALAQVLGALEAEGLRLRATARATELVAQAMSGTRFVPRL